MLASKKNAMLRAIMLLAAILMTTGCTSLRSLAGSVPEANMDDTMGGKVRWSLYEATDFFC